MKIIETIFNLRVFRCEIHLKCAKSYCMNIACLLTVVTLMGSEFFQFHMVSQTWLVGSFELVSPNKW